MPSKTKRPATKPSADDKQKEQSARFMETARKLEADESGEAFKRLVEHALPKARRGLKGPSQEA